MPILVTEARGDVVAREIDVDDDLPGHESSSDPSDGSGIEFGGPDDGPGNDESEDMLEEEASVSDDERSGPVPALVMPILGRDIRADAEEVDLEVDQSDEENARQSVAPARAAHYRDYRRLEAEVEDIFGLFEQELPWGAMTQIARMHPDIPGRTIRNWY
jgi:hypothetical protein